MEYSGARILIEALVEQGVDTVFGYPGGSVLFIYDELYKNSDRIRHILVSHEQHAAHAADGYARSTGKTGVCIATSGPGATNLVTGIATAYMDSVPLVAITGNVATNLLGKDSFQEVDIAGVTMPVVKHNWIVKDAAELAEVVREAFIVANSGRPGPVLIDIPKDVTSNFAEWTPSKVDTAAIDETLQGSAAAGRARRLSARNMRKSFSGADIEQAVLMIRGAKHPFIYAGGGVISSGACDELKAFAERIKAPVALTLMALGALDCDNPFCTGMIGMHGTVASNKAVQKSDLLITIGARFSDRVTSRTEIFAKNAKILQFDIDPAEINKNIQTNFEITGNIKLILRRILEALAQSSAQDFAPDAASGWLEEIVRWKAKIPKAHHRETELHPRFIIEETGKRLGAESIVVTDVGQHQMWAAQFYPHKRPRAFLSSGGLGTMGFGLGAALGAKIANPKCPVVLMTGDGSFRMNCAELSTLAAYKIPVLIIIFNNKTLGMVRQWQQLFYDGRYSETTLDRPPDFVKLAEAYSVPAYRAVDEKSFMNALDAALSDNANGVTTLIDAIIDIDEMVLPMVPGGKPVDEQLMQLPARPPEKS
ncbi:MAG: biosynthetic-type acetolactate synthase large subunit [Spirochaetaceae bacterium]|jgi:acetolactate synthase-1/2/3 large subunit|nr:biosynthetic-type acetolactate synthase large subunit [Spirochaetaceae bacterium]